jgi:glycosyltransferase involved in cell wall biosynthesis
VSRPAVSVITPFRGDGEAASAALRALGELLTRDGDELIVVDNGGEGAVGRALGKQPDEQIVVIDADQLASSYYARNVGAQRAKCPWILFIDADCLPRPDLLDAYFHDPPAKSCGAVAGEILPLESDSLLGGWAASRRVLQQTAPLQQLRRPAAVTANLLVRREAWQSVGGFAEGVRSSGDVDFCWRIQDAGWSLGRSPRASVRRPPPDTLRGLVRQMARCGAGNAWLARRYPGALQRPSAAWGLTRSIVAVILWLLGLRPRRAAYKAIDFAAIAALQAGYLGSNAARHEPRPDAGIVALTDSYARHTETFVANEVKRLVALGEAVRVESIYRPAKPLVGAERIAPATYVEDQGTLVRLRALAWLLLRHPLGVLRDLTGPRTWAESDRDSRGGRRLGRGQLRSLPALALASRRLEWGGERHMHVHFATVSAMTARRLQRIHRIPYSITVYGFDIWAKHMAPGLREKLIPAAFVTSGCTYDVRHLRQLLGGEAAARVHKIVLGVDPGEFVRDTTYPGGGTVAAVGRLVEKKGFATLIAAAAEIEDGLLDRIVIVGDGPLRTSLEERARKLDVAEQVEFRGSLDPDEVKEVLEGADLLAMPCTVAADGDRDSMPVVVKEALAMEIPVVATDEVGLSEAVDPDCGRLIPPDDPVALARAISELLRLPPEERVAMGRAGREWVLRCATIEGQVARLLELINSSAASRSGLRTLHH